MVWHVFQRQRHMKEPQTRRAWLNPVLKHRYLPRFSAEQPNEDAVSILRTRCRTLCYV
jgi:hypothetical protein